jgi:hypothetical protein
MSSISRSYGCRSDICTVSGKAWPKLGWASWRLMAPAAKGHAVDAELALADVDGAQPDALHLIVVAELDFDLMQVGRAW